MTFSDLDGPGQRLKGWDVRGTSGRYRLTLPFGVDVGTSAAAARQSIPGAQGRYDETFGVYELTSKRVPGLIWFSDRANGMGPITSISLSPTFCD